MINITSNPAQKLAYGVASATVAFTTDSTPAIQTTTTAGAGQAYLTLASTAGMVAGDFIATENANSAGTGPCVTTILGNITATNINVTAPATRIAVTNAVVNRFERIEARYKAKKVTLTNLTNGDVYVWDTTLPDNQAYKTSGGTTTTVTNGILNRSNCVAIHPNLLPVSSSFSLKLDYDYYS